MCFAADNILLMRNCNNLTSLRPASFENSSGARFSKVWKVFASGRKAVAKSQTLWLQSCFIHVFLIWTEVLFIQEVSGVYTSPFLDTDELKMVLRARKVSGALVKRIPGPVTLRSIPNPVKGELENYQRPCQLTWE